MEASFWKQAWSDRRIGFHKSEVHPDLITYGHLLKGRVLVPLCGKTLDLRHLVDQGHEVVAVELSAVAITELAAEQGFHFTSQCFAFGNRHRDGNLTVWEADFFDLSADALGSIDGVWDRAARVALPADMRERYVAHLRALAPGASLLLNALDGGPQMPSPPHGVNVEEVMRHHPNAQLLDTADQMNEMWAERGMTSFFRRLFHVPCL